MKRSFILKVSHRPYSVEDMSWPDSEHRIIYPETNAAHSIGKRSKISDIGTSAPLMTNLKKYGNQDTITEPGKGYGPQSENEGQPRVHT